MAHETDGEDRLRTPAGAASPPDGPSPAQPAPPPRPGLSYASPAPIVAVKAAPRSITLARTLWLFSFVAGLAVLVGSFLTRDSHLERLRTVVQDMAPDGDAEAVTTAAGIVFWGSVGALLLVILLQAAMLGVVMGRQGWARWALVPLLAGQVLVMLVAATFLVPAGDGGSYVVMLWGLQTLLAFIGLVLFFVPASNAWLKSGR
ncbi:hypothetical protein D7Z96_18500 [Pseudarthrobacter phenanthrenivorans]|jgi:hypothetical protein|uniref:Uncharacterized protein n=1 Tax=Pseudarthrobacter phenanthrenivorans TaxID=361575 RepID=A0A3B0FLF9_PSEPS|nr:hypothetical protein [Pseudarthrobacter phenanthrenivorans]RKO20528.1 hypothetical protein D7Z96_18500 [Pseudarthrobacter phenanthrenivorans]